MAIYLENVQINSFRGIQQLEVLGLNHVNIIAGDNNSGKTSILEALMLLKNPSEFSNILRVSRLRDIPPYYANSASPYENFINLFPCGLLPLNISLLTWGRGGRSEIQIEGDQVKILLDARDRNKRFSSALKSRERQLSFFDDEDIESECFKGNLRFICDAKEIKNFIEFYPFSQMTGREISRTNFLNMVYLSPTDHIRGNVFNRIIRNDSYKDVCLRILQLFDTEITDLLILKNEITGRSVEYIKHKTLGSMPISTYGDGIKKVLSLANGIAQAADGVLMIDEIETAIHTKYYEDILRFIVKACKQFQVQVFITTHSIEAIDSLLATQDYDQQSKTDDISVLTFKKDSANSKTYSRVLSGRHVYSNREAFGFEVRL